MANSLSQVRQVSSGSPQAIGSAATTPLYRSGTEFETGNSRDNPNLANLWNLANLSNDANTAMGALERDCSF
jgi:hypothetical protein